MLCMCHHAKSMTYHMVYLFILRSESLSLHIGKDFGTKMSGKREENTMMNTLITQEQYIEMFGKRSGE